MPFSPEVKSRMFARCMRLCCLCQKQCGTNIEAAHIIDEAAGGSNDEENGIPLCFDCHQEMGAYRDSHPKGNKFRPDELRVRRDKVYELVESGRIPRGASGEGHTTTIQAKDVNAAVLIQGPNAINISGPNAVVLGPNAIKIVGPVVTNSAPVKGGDVEVSSPIIAGAGLLGPGGDVTVEGGTGREGASGGNIRVGPGQIRAGDGGLGGKGGDIVIKGGDAE